MSVLVKPGACELCSQRGGPLIPTVEGTWAHMTCALWHPQTYIDDQGRVLDVAKVPKVRFLMRPS